MGFEAPRLSTQMDTLETSLSWRATVAPAGQTESPTKSVFGAWGVSNAWPPFFPLPFVCTCGQGLLERLLVGFAALGGCAALDAPDPATSNKSVDSKASAKTSPLATGSWRSFSWSLSDKNRKGPLVLVEQSLPSNQEEAVCANDQAGLHGMLP